MITEVEGDLLAADVEALVNTVNTVGVMGKGIALQFRRRYPDMFAHYTRAAKAGQVRLGHVEVWETETFGGPRFVINFPTKGHWRAASKLADIEAGLVDLVRVINELGIRSIAVPPLGCGNGGLDWATVRPVIVQALGGVGDVDVLLYAPSGAPAAAEQATATPRPRMTEGRAALIHLLCRYQEAALQSSLVEVQKLLYFLQAAGEPLRLDFVKGRYGPYADNLRHVLREVEGHYLVGFGDGSSPVLTAEPIDVLPGAGRLAADALDGQAATVGRIERVLGLVNGFESMYGMELLASTHWVTLHDDDAAAHDSDLAVKLVQEWSPRKGQLFTAEHITAAWGALRDHGWLAAS